jgi:hypothetical protein
VEVKSPLIVHIFSGILDHLAAMSPFQSLVVDFTFYITYIRMNSRFDAFLLQLKSRKFIQCIDKRLRFSSQLLDDKHLKISFNSSSYRDIFLRFTFHTVMVTLRL